jgi:hypothetical protein
LGDGTVLLYRHLDQSLFSTSTSLTSLPKPRTIHESPTEPITALGFREPSSSPSAANPQTNGHAPNSDKAKENPNLYLFIVTTSRVLSYQATGRVPSSSPNPAIVDEVGAGLGCAVMDWHKRDIVVAREEAVYVCGVEGRGSCFAYEGAFAFFAQPLFSFSFLV